MAKRIGVIGTGRFGESLVQSLAEQGAEILLMDMDREKVQNLAEYVNKAIEGDATNIRALEDAGFATCSVVVVAIGENIEGSIMATVNCKELGIETVVAKAASDVHGKVLRRVGADVVVYPNRDRAQRLARALLSTNQVDLFEISDGFSVAEIAAPEFLHSHSLAEVNVRQNYEITVLAVRRLSVDDPVSPRQVFVPGPTDIIRADDRLLVFGRDKKIDAFAQN